MWLRPFLCDAVAGGGRFGAGFDLNLIPDVFRTARTLARAVSRHASDITIADDQGNDARANDYHRRLCADHGSGGVESFPLYQANGDVAADRGSAEPFLFLRDNDDSGNRGAAVEKEQPTAVIGQLGGATRRPVIDQLEPPRRALIGRLRRVPEAGALVSWVSSLGKTVEQYRQWIPWQPFADELRGLLLLGVREQPRTAAGRVDGGGGGRGDAAATAGVFAVCELLLIWQGEQVSFILR